jgi:transcriptional regulator with GAF, ATPase, and Fis domain
VIAAAVAARDGRPALRPEPVDLSENDVLSRVCDLLDRKLFETSVAAEVTAIPATTHGFEQTVAEVLGVLRRFVDYDLAAVMLVEERTAYVSVARECSQTHFSELVNSGVDAVAASSGTTYTTDELDARVADPENLLGADDEGRMATFLSMPLRGHGGRVLGVLALSSASKNAFGETALATLRLVEGPAAIVVDNARLAGARTG